MSLFKPRTKTQIISPDLQTRINNWPDDYFPVDSPVSFESLGMPYSQIYRSQQNVRSVVRFFYDNISQPKIKLWGDADDDGIDELLSDHPVQKLLDSPNPGTSRVRFMKQIVGDLTIYDHAFIWKQRDANGEVVALQRIPMRRISIASGNILAPNLFTIEGENQNKPVPIEDAIYIHGFSPTTNAGGVSALESLRQVLAELEAQAKDRRAFWRRGARSMLFFKTDPATRIDKDSRKRFIEKFRQENTGQGPDSRGVGMLPTGVEPVTVGMSAEDSQLIPSKQFSREEIAIAYGISPEVLGIRPSNFASVDAYHQQLWSDTFAPIMIQLQEEFETQLLYADFEDIASGFHLEFNIDAKLWGSPLERAQLGVQVTGGPTMSTNEWRLINNQIPIGDPFDLANPYNQIASPLNSVRGGGPQPSPMDSTNQFTGGQTAPGEDQPVDMPGAHSHGGSRLFVPAKSDDAESKLATSEFKSVEKDPVFITSQDHHQAALTFFFERMKNSVVPKTKASGSTSFNQDRWSKELYTELRPLATSTVNAAGTIASRRYASTFRPNFTTHYLDAGTKAVSEGVIASVALDLEQGADNVPAVFDQTLQQRVPQLSFDRAHSLTQFGYSEAAKQVGKGNKTWQVNSANSRHPERDGTTIPIHSEWDWGPDWEPNCQCTISYA